MVHTYSPCRSIHTSPCRNILLGPAPRQPSPHHAQPPPSSPTQPGSVLLPIPERVYRLLEVRQGRRGKLAPTAPARRSSAEHSSAHSGLAMCPFHHDGGAARPKLSELHCSLVHRDHSAAQVWSCSFSVSEAATPMHQVSKPLTLFWSCSPLAMTEGQQGQTGVDSGRACAASLRHYQWDAPCIMCIGQPAPLVETSTASKQPACKEQLQIVSLFSTDRWPAAVKKGGMAAAISQPQVVRWFIKHSSACQIFLGSSRRAELGRCTPLLSSSAWFPRQN